MAFITVEDIYGSIDCVAFPSIFERIKAVLANDKIVRLRGKLDMSKEDEPSIILDDMTEFDITQTNEPKPTAARKSAILWLNATNLSEEDFDEMVSMLSNYEGTTTCALVRGGKKFKLPHGVNYCKGLLAELSAFIFEKDIKYIE